MTDRAHSHPHMAGESGSVSITLRDEFGNAVVGRHKCFFLRQKDDSHVASAGALSEACAVDAQNMFLLEQLGDKRNVVFRDVEFREGVKSSLWSDQRNARCACGPLDREVAAAAQLCAYDLSDDPAVPQEQARLRA